MSQRLENIHRTRWTRRAPALGALAVLGLTLLFILFPVLERVYLTQLGEKEASTLTLAAERLEGSPCWVLTVTKKTNFQIQHGKRHRLTPFA